MRGTLQRTHTNPQEAWSELNECSSRRLPDAPYAEVDLSTLAGNETRQFAMAGCPTCGAVEHWALEGEDHSPFFEPQASVAEHVLGWLMAHTNASCGRNPSRNPLQTLTVAVRATSLSKP